MSTTNEVANRIRQADQQLEQTTMEHPIRYDEGWCTECKAYKPHIKVHWAWRQESYYGLDSRICINCGKRKVINPFFSDKERTKRFAKRSNL